MDEPGLLAHAVEARRRELKLTQEELATEAKVSLTTVRDVEKGRRVSMRASGQKRLTAALGWTTDSIDRILRGEDPLPVTGIYIEPGAEPRPQTDPAIVKQITELRARIVALEEKVERQGRDLLAARAGRADAAAHEPQAG